VAGFAIVGDQLEAVVGRLGAFLASHPYELTPCGGASISGELLLNAFDF